MPARNLVIVDVSNGTEIEKKVAEQADLFFSREMKTAALLGSGGIYGYKATFTLSLQNVSGGALDNVSLIEKIPSEVAADASIIRSDQNFTVLEKEPVIKFDLGTIPEGGLKRAGYSVQFGEEKIADIEAAFRHMEVPTALIPLAKEDCTGIMCNDFSPCTADYCRDGKCVYENSAEGVSCGDELACTEGVCKKAIKTSLWLNAGLLIIIGAIISASAIVIAKAKNKKRETGKQN